MFKTTYSAEENDFFLECKGISHKKIQEKFKAKFGREITYSAVKHKMQRICGGNGVDARYKKGNTSHLLVKNRHNPSKKSDFEECIRHGKDGNEVFIKINGEWVRKKRYVWEQHNGTIPDGYVIMAKDGNNENCDIDNLVMVSRDVCMEFGRKNYNELDKELRETAIYLSQLACDIRGADKNNG